MRYCVSRPDDDAGREVPLSNKWTSRSKHAGISSSRASGRAGHYAADMHAHGWSMSQAVGAGALVARIAVSAEGAALSVRSCLVWSG